MVDKGRRMAIISASEMALKQLPRQGGQQRRTALEPGRWHSPISGLTTLAFVADRASFALSKDSIDSPEDKAALLEAAELLDAALEGEEKLRKREFGAAAAHQFSSLAWTARALSGLANVGPVQASSDIEEVIRALSKTLKQLERGERVDDEEWVGVANRFFGRLTELVLASARQVTDSVAVRGEWTEPVRPA